MRRDASKELDRLRAQSAAGDPELLAEILLVFLCITVSAYAFGLWWLYGWYLVQYLLVLTERHLLRNHPHWNSRGYFLFILALNLLIGSNFALLPVLLWEVDHDVFKFAVVALLTGSTLNTFLVRARVWQAMLCFVLPNGTAMFLIALSFRRESDVLMDTVTAVVIAFAILVYFLVCVLHAFRWHVRHERTEQSLERARRSEAIGRLTGGIAHDFNNLLFVIMGNLEAVRRMSTDKRQIDLIDRGLRATERGADLTRNILRFARKANLAPRVVNLNSVVEETTRFAVRTLPANIAIETDLADDLWEVETDASSTESALLNLLLNACDAMPEGGRVRVATANRRVTRAMPLRGGERLPAGRYATISISDTGRGIAESELPRIFEPFESSKPDGTGLGLTMIDVFMRETGGGIDVISAMGAGTTFTLYFRARRTGAPRVAATRRGGHIALAAPGARVLLVEDDLAVREALLRMLDGTGHEILAVESGDAAWALFQADPGFDLVVTDVVVPGRLQGAALAEKIRVRRPELPVLFLSGHDFGALCAHPGVRATDIRLAKPVRRAQLVEAIAMALDRSQRASDGELPAEGH